MLNKITFIALVLFTVTNVAGQENKEPFYVNVFISADKTIYVETNKTSFQEVETKVAEIIRNAPFKIDQRINYRIFADENLKLGYIMDVNREMLKAFNDNVSTSKYLLNTTELNIDGQNWFDSIDLNKLKPQN